jgi:hypothetical protein
MTFYTILKLWAFFVKKPSSAVDIYVTAELKFCGLLFGSSGF